ncbi:MAG TPA: glycosyltransferase family A protein [Solirubrobacteraceae bacterium]|jgi:glycosyltransferase involved in cell wall biosynthesis|nr:glycosyltransferase family A protein [Solirubrobacteraceae bacterium]
MSEDAASPLVSVIVPVHRGERFLAEALDSIEAQTHRPLETIVIDDGSPDESAAIAEARHWVRLLRQRQLGVPVARNAGLAAAEGEFIAFLDQDDLWHPQKLERQLELLRARPDVDIVFTKMEVVLMDGIQRPPWCRPEWLQVPPPAFLPSAWLVRRSAFERIGVFDPGFSSGCDTDWLVRAGEAGLRNETLDDPLIRWRIHGANGSYDLATVRREMFTILRRNVALRAGERHAG